MTVDLRPDLRTWKCRGQELPVAWDDAVERLLRPAGSSPPPFPIT